MRIRIAYENGRIDFFDTAKLVAAEPFGRANVMTELSLRLDISDTEGICLDIDYDEMGAADGDGGEPYASRMRGCRVCLAEPADLEKMESAAVDGELVMWRQGGKLVDGVAFEQAKRLWYSGVPYASDSYKACRIYEYLEAARPDLAQSPERLCALFGYPLEAFAEARRYESAQPCDADYGEEV